MSTPLKTDKQIRTMISYGVNMHRGKEGEGSHGTEARTTPSYCNLRIMDGWLCMKVHSTLNR